MNKKEFLEVLQVMLLAYDGMSKDEIWFLRKELKKEVISIGVRLTEQIKDKELRG